MSDDRPESQSLRGCIAAQNKCRERIEAILDSHRSEQRGVNAEVFHKLDDIREKVGVQDTAEREAVSGRGFWRTVGLPILIAVLTAVATASVMGGLGAYFAAPAKAAPGGP